MWGCSVALGPLLRHGGVFPTHVGMFRPPRPILRRPPRFPHACGDVPPEVAHLARSRGFSPRMWGCSASKRNENGAHRVFPTHVGMFRLMALSRLPSVRFPHACGDVPFFNEHGVPHPGFSPRMWGCSVGSVQLAQDGVVFPTHVGMFRTPPRTGRKWRRFPHACGDVPLKGVHRLASDGFSPRMWGCSGQHIHTPVFFGVFPTHVGMFRVPTRENAVPSSFPHACGDVPVRGLGSTPAIPFSPRMWGCSGG